MSKSPHCETAIGSTAQLIREYYAAFNERRVGEVRTLFAPAAIMEAPPFAAVKVAPEAYLQFAAVWLKAFPDGRLRVERVEQRSDAICEVELTATGTHTGLLDLGAYGVMKPGGVRLALRLRELLEIAHGKIAYSSLAFDMNHLVRQLNQVDYRQLLGHLEALSRLTSELEIARGDTEREHEVAERIGRILDAARRVVRPQYNR